MLSCRIILFKPELAHGVASDIESVSPETMVRLHAHDSKDPWDFEQVFAGLYEFARNYPFKTEEEQYLFHISTGTHVHQICLFLLAESRHLPGKLIQTSPSPRKSWQQTPNDADRLRKYLARFDLSWDALQKLESPSCLSVRGPKGLNAGSAGT